MKRFATLISILLFAVLAIPVQSGQQTVPRETPETPSAPSYRNGTEAFTKSSYKYPQFYRGIYLNSASARNLTTLKEFVRKAKPASINAFVMDVQGSRTRECIVPAENVQYCKDNGIHAVARVVMFPDGLRKYPVSDSYIEERLDAAESSCKNGFKEIQFDYIRFNDSGATKHLTLKQKYAFIEGIINRARTRLKQYNVIFAADIFGRIPLNTNDLIGQNMESLDRVVDMICPMAYPSHYTWSPKYYANPYFAVHQTSVQAKKRAQNAVIVTYIQAFKMKLGTIPYERYIADQIQAVHDAGIKGYFLWNARQDYDIPLQVVKSYNAGSISRAAAHREDSAN